MFQPADRFTRRTSSGSITTYSSTAKGHLTSRLTVIHKTSAKSEEADMVDKLKTIIAGLFTPAWFVCVCVCACACVCVCVCECVCMCVFFFTNFFQS